ncbi:RNA polymerase sigma factor [Rhodococcus triatomae]
MDDQKADRHAGMYDPVSASLGERRRAGLHRTERKIPGEHDVDDAALVAQAKQGDHRAFAELVNRHRSKIEYVCLQITCNHSDAEDALQEALTAAWQNLDKFRGDARFATWIHRIAANSSLAIVKRRKPVDSIDAASEEFGILLEDPSAEFDDRLTTVDAVRRALATLPDDFRVAIVLAEFASLPYTDIAEHQGVSVATVKTRIHRARKKLAEILAPTMNS